MTAPTPKEVLTQSLAERAVLSQQIQSGSVEQDTGVRRIANLDQVIGNPSQEAQRIAETREQIYDALVAAANVLNSTEVDRAVNLISSGQYDDALRLLEKVRSFDESIGTATVSPQLSYICLVLSDIYEARHDLAKSLERAEEALSFSPNDVRCITALARLYGMFGRTQDSLRLAQQGRNLVSNEIVPNPSILTMLADSFNDGFHWNEALDLYTQAFQIYEKTKNKMLARELPVIRSIASLFTRRLQLKEADQWFRRAQSLIDRPDVDQIERIRFENNIALNYLLMGCFSGARAQVNALLAHGNDELPQEDPLRFYSVSILARTQFEQGAPIDDVLNELEEARDDTVATFKTSSWRLAQIDDYTGEVRDLSGDVVGAKADYMRAERELNAIKAPPVLELARISLNLGRALFRGHDEAGGLRKIAKASQLIEANPDFSASIQARLSVARAEQSASSEPAAAYQQLRRALDLDPTDFVRSMLRHGAVSPELRAVISSNDELKLQPRPEYRCDEYLLP